MGVTRRTRMIGWCVASLVAVGLVAGGVLTVWPQLLTPVLVVSMSCLILAAGPVISWRIRSARLARHRADRSDRGSGPPRGGTAAGVREPRNPHPPQDQMAAAVAPPDQSAA